MREREKEKEKDIVGGTKRTKIIVTKRTPITAAKSDKSKYYSILRFTLKLLKVIGRRKFRCIRALVYQ